MLDSFSKIQLPCERQSFKFKDKWMEQASMNKPKYLSHKTYIINSISCICNMITVVLIWDSSSLVLKNSVLDLTLLEVKKIEEVLFLIEKQQENIKWRINIGKMRRIKLYGERIETQ